MLTSKLRQRLQELSPDLNSRLHGISAKAAQVLEYAQGGAHLTFTPHGASHVSAVEANYDWLLSDADIAGFNAREIFCLLSATFFHDTMMIPTELGGEASARSKHAELARTFLIKNKDLIGFDLREADAIGDVIRGHGLDDLTAVTDEVVLGSQIVDVRKLAACLSLADIAHADASRAPEIVLEHLNLDEDSSRHWKRHLQISGITRRGDSLLMSALVFSEDGKRAVEEYADYIEQQLRVVRPYFYSVLQPIKRVDLSVKKLESALDQTLRFQTNTSGILKVLIEGIYDRQDVFVRELVQNSLDACLLRRVKLQRRNVPYSPRILITAFSEKKRVRAIRVDDNGVGMDINDVQSTVLWIGSSISNQNDIAELVQKALGKNLIATFGIGLLSCFKASNRILITTAKENSTPLRFELTSVSDAVKPEKSTDGSIGTSILVDLAEDGPALDIVSTVEHYFRHVNQVELRVLELNWSETLVARTREDLEKIARTEAPVIRAQTHAEQSKAVHVPLAGDDYSGALWLDSAHMSSLGETEGTLDILNEGVFVAAEDTADWLGGQFAFLSGYVNYSARSLNLPAGRDRVIKDDVFRRKATEINAKAFRAIDLLVEQSRNGGEARSRAALLLTHIYERASAADQTKVLNQASEFCLQVYKAPRLLRLSEIRDTVYIHYPKGRFVEDLTAFDGKQLYHKQDDLTDLQAAIMSQRGATVISATANDAGDSRLLEATFIAAYLKSRFIKSVDLSSDNVIEGKYRSKSVPQMIRQRIQNTVKFVEIGEMPNKISWRVGTELWINVAHPIVSRLYRRLTEQPTDSKTVDLTQMLVDLLSYDLEGVFETIVRLIEASDSEGRSPVVGAQRNSP